MARIFVSVSKLVDEALSFTPDFKQPEWHGAGAGKGYGRSRFVKGKTVLNNAPDVHPLDKDVMLAIQYVRDWSRTVFGGDGVPIRINSTYRTPYFNNQISSSGKGGAHTKKIAVDWKFTGELAATATSRFNTHIRDNGAILGILRSFNVNGIGLYGPDSPNGSNFCHFDTRALDGSDGLPATDTKDLVAGDGLGSTWTSGHPLYDDALDESEPALEANPATTETYGSNQPSQKVVKWTNSGEYNGKTIEDLVSDPNFVGYGMDATELGNFKHEGVSNKKRVWQALDLPNKKLFGDNSSGAYNPSKDYVLGRGVTLYIPIGEVSTISSEADNASAGGTSNQSTQTSHESTAAMTEYSSNITVTKGVEGKFYPKVLKYVSLDPGYVPAYKDRGVVAKSIYPRLKVYAWSRAIYLENRHGFVDVTPCVQQMHISSTFNGSEFNIKLSPLIGRLNGKIDQSQANNQPLWQMSDFIDTRDGQVVKLGAINREVLFKDNRVEGSTVIASEYVRNHQYYEKIFQQNDMFFIRFEQLESDSDDNLSIQDKIGKGWYDLIGLADYAEVASTAQTTDVSINVMGRDLTKALLEDNSYFNPFSVGHSESIYGGDVGGNDRFLGGAFLDVSAIIDRSIKQSMEFIFHRISSIGYVPNEVFELFPNKTEVSVFKKQKESDSDTKPVEVKPARGVWQLVKFWIDENIAPIRLVDDSVSNPQGSIWELMKKVCQDPFVELFTETLGSHFYVIARKPPFEQTTLSRIVGEVQSDTTGGADNRINGGGYIGSPSEGPKKSAYLKYLDCLEKKNASKRTPQFTIEAETYGDSSNRKKLAALEKIKISSGEEKDYLEKYGTVIVDDKIIDCNESLRSISDSTFPLIININEDDVLRDNFRMTQTAFSWYQIHDRGNFAGQNVSLGHVPALYFDDYAQVFGNRKLEVTSNYSDYRFFETKNKEKYSNLYAEQASQLLSFLVETNIHLPFTREGSFTINGDRRIKKGNYIYYRPTREVFYVDRVENDISIMGKMDRTTTVTVSRGMVIDYIDGIEEELYKKDGTTEKKFVSYFNIVNIEKLRNGIYDVVNGGPVEAKFDYKADMSVDVDIMNFFLKRKQFKEYDI